MPNEILNCNKLEMSFILGNMNVKFKVWVLRFSGQYNDETILNLYLITHNSLWNNLRGHSRLQICHIRQTWKALIENLIERGIPASDIRVLQDLYKRKQIRTSWKRYFSKTFPSRNGIRQGGIASPILFCCYLDKLVELLQSNGSGCWIGDNFLGSVVYADDITLLCPTVKGL